LKLFPPQKTEYDKGHGRIETRKIWTGSTLESHISFPFATQVFLVERLTTDLNGNKKRLDSVYGITSLDSHKADAEKLLSLNRNHWSIENRLHYVRDVTFDEDRSRVRKGKGAHMMATLRNISISLLRKAGFDNIAKGLRHCSYSRNDTFRLIGIRLA